LDTLDAVLEAAVTIRKRPEKSDDELYFWFDTCVVCTVFGFLLLRTVSAVEVVIESYSCSWL
jgi:hypothetical protein